MCDSDVTIPNITSQEMSEGGVSEVPGTETESVIVTSDSDKGSVSSLSGSKIFKPSGLKQPSSLSTSTTRIGRPCNNIPKPAVPKQIKVTAREGTVGVEGLPMLKARLSLERSFSGRSSTKFIKIESLTRLSDYSNSLRYAYAKTFNHLTSYNGGYYGRVSLRDIGIRQPVVHFDLDYDHFRSSGGVGGGGTMAYTSSLRKTSDDFARRRISDFRASDENVLPFFGGGKWISDRKSSSGSVLSDSSRKSSSDDLRRKKSSDGSLSLDSSSDYWKFDHEPRRTSDISVVLTQDTDSFIIGDRVWVGGTKPGQIAYIGETQFAPGDWAGVVLDEPIGKNDGSVANIRYFQCEPKRGIFSRLTRLTRYPLLDCNSVEITPPRTLSLESARNDAPNAKAVPKKLTPVPTPTTPAPRTSFSKPSSPDSIIHPNINIGDRVIVMSSQGSKAGVLRFLGATDFAPGEWCGVELDDPLGKNDGSVAGTRYFECRPKFGLFAPLHKVSKSPASRRPSQASCQIHRGGGSVGIRRQGSRESLVSMSSVASTATSLRSSSRKVGVRTPTTPTSTKNALQEILKEKELHIDQLLKERDLERAEVTRAASQADEAEKRLSVVQQELEQVKEESEAKIADLDAMVCLLRAENEDLSGQLEEERKKYEDAQFRFEEVSIETGDLNGAVKNLEDKVTVLEKNLADERKRVEVLELESNKLFEAEEQLVIVRDENDVLKEKLAQNELKRSTLEKEQTTLEAMVTSLRAEILSLKAETEASKSRDENNLRESLADAVRTLEETKLKLSNKQEELDRLSKDLENTKSDFTLREKDLSEKNLIFVRDLTEKHKLEVAEINGKLEELKISSDLKIKVLEEKLSERMQRCSELETEVQDHNLKLSKAASDRLAEESKRKETEELLEKERAENKQAINKIEDNMRKELEKSKTREETVDELKRVIKESEENLERVVAAKENEVSVLNEIVNTQKNELEIARNEIVKTMNQLRQLQDSYRLAQDERETKFKDLDIVLKDKDTEIERLTSEIERLKRDHELDSVKCKEDFEIYKKEQGSRISELERCCEEEVKGLKEQVAKADSLLKVKEEELEKEKKLKQNLLEKLGETEASQKLLTSEKDKLLLEAGDSNRKIQSFEERLMLMIKQKEKLESDLTAFMNSSNDSSAQLTKLNEELRLKEKETDMLRQELSDKIAAFERAQQEHQQTLSSKEKEFEAKEKRFTDRENELACEIDKLRKDMENASANSSARENDLKSKMDCYVKEAEERVKSYEEKINSLERVEKEKTEKYEQDVRDLVKSQEALKEMLKLSEAELKKLENDKKVSDEGLMAENERLKQEIELIKAEDARMRQELTEKAREENLKHSSEGEKLRKDVEEANKKLQTALMQIEEMGKEKAKLDEEKLVLQNRVTALEDTGKRSKTEMENRLLEIENENNILKNTLTQLREEKLTVDKSATDKEMTITDLKTQLKAADEWKKKGEEKDKKIEILESKLSEMEKGYEKKVSERDNALQKLKQEMEEMRNDLERMKSGAEFETGRANELKKTLETAKTDIMRKEEETTALRKDLVEVRELLHKEKKISEENRKKVVDLESEKCELSRRIQEQDLTLSKSKESNVLVQELTQKVKEGEETVKKAMADVDVLTKTVEERENTIKNLSNDIETLKLERSSLLNNNKIAVESLEKEKTQLQKKIEEMETNNQNITVKGDEDFLEDREFTQGQVDFLNSVIVDMQKKNDALKARIEILEMGFSPEDVEDYTLENLKRTTAPPRLFCDICDVFDRHDTEDCPTQATDPDAPPPKSSKAVPPPPRPYCDVCEVFGHDTSECDDGETF